MSQGAPQATPLHSTTSVVSSAAFWLATGVMVGLVAAGGIPLSTGAPVAAGCAVVAMLAARKRPRPPASAAARDDRDDASRTVAALGTAVGEFDRPEVGLEDMLRQIAGSIGSKTVLLFQADGDSTSLMLQHPSLIDNSVAEARPTVTFRVADHRVVRLALAAGIPMAANRSEEAPVEWSRLMDRFEIGSSILVPLTAGDAHIGLLVVAEPESSVPRAHLTRLRRIAPTAGAAVGALLHLRELRNATARSARTERFRSDYASVVGHELRTPLTTIIGVIKTLSRPELAPSNPDSRDLLEMASAQGNRLRRLVEDMLAINQVGGDNIPVHPELVPLDTVIQQGIDAVPGADALVSFEMGHSIPAVILDPVHTKRVIKSLIANAVKYGEDSSIEVSTSVVRDDLVITVADHGPGLPPATAASAFDAFTQLNRTEVDAYGGVGLGLSISQGLVEAMGGTIRYEPTEGNGATFIITLPFKPHAVPGATF